MFVQINFTSCILDKFKLMTFLKNFFVKIIYYSMISFIKKDKAKKNIPEK